jgi:hypothetical protein
MIQKILRKRHHDNRVYIRKESGHYLVVSDPIPNEQERQSIIHDVQQSFGMEQDSAPQTKSSTLSGKVTSSIGYNNNIYDHTRIKTTTYNHFTIDNNTSIVSDFFTQNSARLYYQYSAKNPALSWNSSISFYDKRYRKHSDLNIRQMAVESGFGYVFDQSYLALPLFFKRLWYGGSGYLHTYGFSPKYTYALDKSTTLSIELNAYKKRFIKSDKKDWNSNHLDAAVGFSALSHSNATLYGKAGIIAERRTRGKRTDVSYNGLFLSGTFIMPLWKKTYADLGFRVDRRIYLHKHPNLALRKDTRIKLNMGIAQPLFENISAKIDYAHVENVSSINAYTHKSDTITLSISAFF